ncbi:hypothetical protein Cgig2_010900 [Carnegiea gigantea]|uniref:Uncharacterized protein n=1 Tax=Carnegiea gigantea TaxID=171969 RepID=A0A9Q1GI01_9CARY|nr:hypothetical protein Cgig2_010900 [Carnegiea gigantea]
MVQAIFYTMVINDAVKLRFLSRETMGSLMLDLQEWRWDIVEAWLLPIEESLGTPKFPALLRWFTILDPQVRRMAKTKSTPRIRSPDELLAEGTQGNPCSAPSSSRPRVEVASTSISSMSRGTSPSSSDRSWRHSSSEGASMSSSSHKVSSTLGKLVLKRKGCSLVGLVPEIVAEGLEFLGAPTHSDSQDGPGSHFPDPKVVPTLKMMTLEKQYLLLVGCNFIIPKADVTVNEPPSKCIVVYAQLSTTVSDSLFTRPGFVTAIEKKLKVKHWKYDFLFIRRESVGEMFLTRARGPGRRKSKSSDRKPLNWLPKLKASKDELMVFETGDVNPEQVAAEAERHRKEERQCLVNQQAKKYRAGRSPQSAYRFASEPRAVLMRPRRPPLPMLGTQEPTSLSLGTLEAGRLGTAPWSLRVNRPSEDPGDYFSSRRRLSPEPPAAVHQLDQG